jgi:hypothetical protein
VAAKVARRLEEHRVETARDRLPRATFTEPVRLFEGYHSTARMLLSRSTQRLTLLERIDPASLRQTSFGAADAQRVVVRGRVLDADPQAFKVRRIGEDAAFYTDGQSVYWPDATPIDGVDAKRFKLVKPCFGFDGQRWYTYDKRVLDDVGDDPTVDASLYFWYLTLLLGSRAVLPRFSSSAGRLTIRRRPAHRKAPFRSHSRRLRDLAQRARRRLRHQRALLRQSVRTAQTTDDARHRRSSCIRGRVPKHCTSKAGLYRARRAAWRFETGARRK